MCFDALKVVLRSFNGVKVDDERGVVVARRGVTDGAIVTLGRVELRLVDAWDWALALSGIFVVVCRCAVVGVQRALNKEGALRRLRAQRQRQWFCRKSYDLQPPWFGSTPWNAQPRAFCSVVASVSLPLAQLFTAALCSRIDDGQLAGGGSKVVRRRRDRSAHGLPAPTREATPKG